MNKETEKLKYLGNLNITDEKYSDKNIDYLISDYIRILKQKQILMKKFESYQGPYKNFLINFYLPSLNIWKDPYNGYIDISLIGEKFIKQNPFLDTNLIDKWTYFFSDLGSRFKNNEVKDLKIGRIQIVDKKYFKIPVSVEVYCPNRWNFLALVNKLSLTSNKKDISLINEFFYYLFKGIKYYNSGSNLTDKEIGEELYRWIKKGSKEKYINRDVIDFVIKHSALCSSLDKVCYLNFKQKFSSIPYLAYTFGERDIDWKTKKKFLKNFLENYMPSLINLKSFSFRQENNLNISNGEVSNAFIVKINFDILGRNITNKEVREISKKLGNVCLGTGKFLNENIALNVVNDKLMFVSKKGLIDSQVLLNYKEIISYIKDIIKNRSKYTNYEYSIKLFEIYRILKENGLCIK